MVCACIDIGSNTTRLLVAEPRASGVRELLRQRAFTHLGKGLRDDDRLSADKIAEVAAVVGTQVRVAQELGVTGDALRVVATAALRECSNPDELLAAITAEAGVRVHLLDDDEEAELAFLGATRALQRPPDDELAVVDVGGASSEIVLGSVSTGARWASSFRIGSGLLADAYQRSDPPSAAELRRMSAHAAGAFEALKLPRPALAVAVGGTATSLRRLIGSVLDRDTLQRGLRAVAGEPAATVAHRYELEPDRVRLLAGGMLILGAISECLARPLTIGRGGLREGVVLDLARGAEHVHSGHVAPAVAR